MSTDEEDGITRREIDTDTEGPSIEIAEIVAELEGRALDELTPLWSCIDGVLENVFSNPPSPEAQFEVTFNYEGYRITVEQDGAARFVKTDR